MKHTIKTLEALRSLQEAELPLLRSFVHSPYHNQREELCRLLDYLLQGWPNFEDSSLNKRQAFEAAYPGKAFDDKQLRYALSALNKLLEAFLLTEKRKEKSLQDDILLMECLSERQLDKAYRQAERRLEREMQPCSHDSAFFLASLNRAEVEERHFQRKRLRQYDTSIQQASEQLDRYYFLQKLKFACAMLDRQSIIRGGYRLGLSSHWMEHLREAAFFNEPIIELYFSILQALIKEEDQGYFEGLIHQLCHPGKEIPVNDLRDIYFFAINYCARKIRKGKKAYLSFALDLYQSGIENEALFDEGKLSPWTFTNVVKLALRLKRYSWIEQFINECGKLMPESFRDNALHFSQAELYYYTDRYQEAQAQLVKVAFSDMNYYLGARVLLAKIYYELKDFEPLLSLLAAFTIFLKRNKELSSGIKETYLNFCDLLFQLLKSKGEKLQRLSLRIEKTPLLTDREWLQKACQVRMSGSAPI